jgi:hypothetical protein
VLVVYQTESTTFGEDLVSEAINHPVGQVTEAALQWWHGHPLEDNQGLTGDLRTILTTLSDPGVEGFRLGRVLLGEQLITLFRVDPAWTREHLIPLFDWNRSTEEATCAWQGFLRSARFHRPLLELLKKSFLATAEHYAALGKLGHRYAGFLTFVSLEAGDALSTAEKAAAARALPKEGLEAVAHALAQAADGAGDQRGAYWRNRTIPFLKSVWPKGDDRATPSVSLALARLCTTSGDAFPDALAALKHLLRPLSYAGLVVYQLHHATLCTQFPKEVLTFLDIVLTDDSAGPNKELHACLEVIAKSGAVPEDDHRLRRLGEYLGRST